MERVTVLGASGFVGSNLINKLAHMQINPFIPARGDDSIFDRHLNNVIYCIGMTADFRTKPFETVEAHVSFLAKVLEKCSFNSFLYLSSTRVYISNNLNEVANEDQSIVVNPVTEPNDLFNISKLMGESLCLNCKKQDVKVARLSNVYGSDIESTNFLTDVLTDIITGHNLILRTSLNSEKDYICIDDVSELLINILLSGRYKIYNVASGQNIRNDQILDKISESVPFDLEVVENPATIKFPRISTERIEGEFEFRPRNLLDEIPNLVNAFQEALIKHDA